MRILPDAPIRSLATACTIALLACTASCSTAKSEERLVSTGDRVPPRQIVTDGWIRSDANVVGMRESMVNGDMKRIAVDVYSDQTSARRFGYRFDWFDAAGMPVQGSTSSMTSVSIKPRETITLTTVAPSPTATQWRLTFLDRSE